MKEEKIFFYSLGMRLEGLLSNPEAFSAKGGVVFCHPHPQHGGEMYNPVIASGVQGAYEAGYSTLRFNFRGVGESEGTYSGGIGERGDVLAAVDYLSAVFGDRHRPLVLMGYSFGAWVGMSVAVRDARIEGMVLVAPPLEMYDFDFLKGCKKKKQIVSGSEDSFCPAPLMEKWYQSLDEPKSLTILQGADHFFFGHHQSLVGPLAEFFKSL
jgi:hypothetical protein